MAVPDCVEAEIIMDKLPKRILRLGSMLDQIDAELFEITEKFNSPFLLYDERISLKSRSKELLDGIEEATRHLDAADDLIEE